MKRAGRHAFGSVVTKGGGDAKVSQGLFCKRRYEGCSSFPPPLTQLLCNAGHRNPVSSIRRFYRRAGRHDARTKRVQFHQHSCEKEGGF